MGRASSRWTVRIWKRSKLCVKSLSAVSWIRTSGVSFISMYEKRSKAVFPSAVIGGRDLEMQEEVLTCLFESTYLQIGFPACEYVVLFLTNLPKCLPCDGAISSLTVWS